MTRIAIDAPTLLLVATTTSVVPGHQLVAPRAVRTDALQLLLDDVRAGRRSDSDALALHEAMTEVKLRGLGDRVSRRTAWRIARERGVDVATAEYVAVARLQADVLVTADPALLRAADGLVPVAGVELLTTPG